MKSVRRDVGWLALVVAAGVGGWFAGGAANRSEPAPATSSKPSWLNYPVALKPPRTQASHADAWQRSMVAAKWTLVGTDDEGGTVIVEPRLIDERPFQCGRFEARVASALEAPQVTVDVKALSTNADCGDVLLGSAQPISIAVPGGLNGRTVVGANMMKLGGPPTSRPDAVTIPNVVGLTFAQAIRVLARTGKRVVPPNTGSAATHLVVTKQDPPGWATIAATDRGSIVLTLASP